MPRDVSGNFTLAAGNPVVSGTVIATTWANPTLADVGQNLTDSLDRFGRGAMLAALRLTDGSAVVPALAWSSETGSGLYRVGAGVMGMTVLANEVSRWSAGQFSTVLGTAAVPPYAFTGDLNTGIYSPGADQIGFSTGGVLRLSIDAAGVVSVTAQFALGLGTAGAPSYSFTGDLNTGIYSPGADQIGLSTAGSLRQSISAAGNVSINTPGSGATLTLTNADQTTSSVSTATANLVVTTPGTSANSGGLLVFGGIQGNFAGIKGLLVNGASNTQGDLSFGTRRVTTDGTLTEAMRIASAGNLTINSPGSGNALQVNQLASTLGLRITSDAGLPSMVFRDRSVNAAAHNVGQILFDAFRDISDPSYVAGIWCSATSPAGNTGDLVFGAIANAATGLPTERLRITSDGRIYGTALHNNVGSVTGTTNQYIASGTYTPTDSSRLSVTSLTMNVAQWMRVGNVVTVSGGFSLQSSATNCSWKITLPIASALTLQDQAGGVGIHGLNGNAFAFYADAAADLITVDGICTTGGSRVFAYSFTYLIQ